MILHLQFVLSLSPGLPPPTVTITSTPSPTAGQTHTLNCFATTEDYVVSVPALDWVSIDGDNIENDQINGTTLANRSLTFDPLRTSHGGCYTCQARIDIPLAGISNRSNSAAEDVRVQSEFIYTYSHK